MVRLEAGLGRGHEWLALEVVLNHVSVHAVTAASRWRRVHRVDVCVDRSQVTTTFFSVCFLVKIIDLPNGKLIKLLL